MSEDSSDVRPIAGQQQFVTTQWSVVLAAGDGGGPDSADALAQLCAAYWYPIYSYVRRRIDNADDAQDLTQSFFTHLLEKRAVGKANPGRGRFRAFLITTLKNFLANHWQKARTAKRGGAATQLSLDFQSGESRYRIEPLDELTPEMLYERRWILTLLDQVLGRLRAELDQAGKGEQFDVLKSALTGEATAHQYEIAGEALGISTTAAKQAAYRLRKRYRQLFRAEVACTLADPADVDDEIGRLLKALGT
jgi:RNA polymerase sigma-70 factor (ECF subfamily)